MFATEAPLYFVEAPRSQEPSRHVLPGPGAGRQLPSSATAPDTSFPTTCLQKSFVLQLFLRWGLSSTLEEHPWSSSHPLGDISIFS